MIISCWRSSMLCCVCDRSTFSLCFRLTNGAIQESIVFVDVGWAALESPPSPFRLRYQRNSIHWTTLAANMQWQLLRCTAVPDGWSGSFFDRQPPQSTPERERENPSSTPQTRSPSSRLKREGWAGRDKALKATST